MFMVAGAISAAIAVLCGAFGAHALKGRLTPEMLAIFDVGVRYHIYHSLGLIAIGLLADRIDSKRLVWAGRSMVAGIFFFSGSLYVLALSGIRWLGAITPIGGVLFILGWLLFAAAARGATSSSR